MPTISFNGTSDFVDAGDLGTIKSVSFWIKTSDVTSRKVINLNGTAQVELDNSGQVVATGWSSPTYHIDAEAGARTLDTQ